MFGLWWVIIGIVVISVIVVIFLIHKDIITDAVYTTFGCLIVVLLLTLIAILCPIEGKYEVRKKQYEYEALSTVAIEYDDFIQTKQFELVSKEIVDRILDYNAWLAEARADKETWGTFSQYIYCDLDSLKFIGE